MRKRVLKNKKRFLPILIFVAIVAILAGVVIYKKLVVDPERAYFKLPTSQSEFDSWKTYENDVYKYSIQYPKNFEARKYEGDRIVPANSKTKALMLYNSEVGNIYIHEIDPQGGLGYPPKTYTNIKDFVTKFFNVKGNYIEPKHIPYDIFSDIRYKVEKFESISVDNKPGIRFIAHVTEDQGASSELDIDIAFIELEHGKIITISGELGNFTIKAGVIDQILSTFKFTK